MKTVLETDYPTEEGRFGRMEDKAKGGTYLAERCAGRVNPTAGPGGDVQGKLKIVSHRAQELDLP